MYVHLRRMREARTDPALRRQGNLLPRMGTLYEQRSHSGGARESRGGDVCGSYQRVCRRVELEDHRECPLSYRAEPALNYSPHL